MDFPTEEFKAAINRASEAVQAEIVALMRSTASNTEHQVEQAYPIGTHKPQPFPPGRLRGEVYQSQPRTYGTSAQGVPIPVIQVRATAPHVHIYQEGTKRRSDATRKGADRGISPRHGPIFERIAATNRTQWLSQAQAILERTTEIG